LTGHTKIKPNKEEKTDETTCQIPPYSPTHVLSPEFQGASNYELGIVELAKEKTETLEQLKHDPEANKVKINQAEEDLKTLDYLYENYNIGMNVFRTAKGGRDKLRTD
jgi:colicin import membrane protein